MKINVTAHAREQAFTRFGWNMKLLLAKAVSALEHGITPSQDEFLAHLYEDTMQANPHSILYYYEGVMFIFDEDRLVTLYGLTGRYRKRN
jgi:hypothetical protein